MLMAFVSNAVKKLTEIFMSLGTVSMLHAFCEWITELEEMKIMRRTDD